MTTEVKKQSKFQDRASSAKHLDDLRLTQDTAVGGSSDDGIVWLVGYVTEPLDSFACPEADYIGKESDWWGRYNFPREDFSAEARVTVFAPKICAGTAEEVRSDMRRAIYGHARAAGVIR